ncbi:DVUA0089 family protein [Puerhibacterium sp. TATVAM-FAB25]|uniref:DVUA0089 family protein n=1 Tax=Puerhibacterium sp. TATVAM-FAB25 TaxID=3093699 RepID=UPI00397E7D04
MAALALAVSWALLLPTVPASAAPSPDHDLDAEHLPRPERPRDVTEREFDADAVLVRFEPGAAKAAKDRALSRRDARAGTAVRGTGWVEVRAEGSAVDLVESLRDDPAVADVSLDYARSATAAPNDPAYAYGDQSYLDTVRLPQAWDRTKGSTSQVVAVVDSGVDVNHPDLRGRTVAGYNAITPGTAPADDNGHGTMVAGIAAADTGNAAGVAGAAWTARVMPVKVLDAGGVGYDSDVAEGVVWAADHGARVINLSLGGPDDGSVLHDAIRYATGKGVVVVVAAGNDGDGRPQYPAAYPEVVAVAATDAAGRLTDFSSHGDWIDVAAPGAAIVSTGPGGGYYVGDGTSFAAPIASGTVALVRTLHPSLTPAQVLARLRGTARDAGPRGIDPYYGYGVLDAYASVGGSWAREFPAPSLGAGEPNDVPARATALGALATTLARTGTVGAEGDVDWYTFSVGGLRSVGVTVTPPAYDLGRSQNVDPVVAVYDRDLRLLDQVDAGAAGDPEKAAVTLAAGSYYVAVSSYNGALDTRPYTVALTSAPTSSAPSPASEQAWVRGASPADFATSVPVTARPAVTFARDVDPASVTASTVRLLSGRTGAPVAAGLSVSGGTVTLTPAAALQDNTPYRIAVSGVTDRAGSVQTGRFSPTFRTVDVAPPAVAGLKAQGALQAATLTWALPGITDLDKVVVRASAGTTAPSSPSQGIAVYAGTGSSAKATGLTAGTTYTFRAWVRDRSGAYGPASTVTLRGTQVSSASSTTALTSGGSVTLTGRLVRKDTGGGLSGLPVQLYGRDKGASSDTLIATVTSGTGGALTYTHKPTKGVTYKWVYRGSGTLTGSVSPLRTVTVATRVTGTLSRTSFPLGGTVTLSGSVAPSHAGRTVYLQRHVGGSWKNVTSRKLSASSAYSFSIKPTTRGTYTYRVHVPADTDHAAGYSPLRSFKVS